jgi:hypothetical protein
MSKPALKKAMQKHKHNVSRAKKLRLNLLAF